MDRIEDWRIFVSVAVLRSFGGAASSLGRSPQAVTRAVARLEERIGARLLNRTTRSVSLTDAGERLMERARQVVADLDQLEARTEHPEPVGRLSITAAALFGRSHVLPVVTEFLRANPQVQVRLLLLDRLVSLADEGMDLAVRLGPLEDSTLKARLIGQVQEVLCASPGYLDLRGVPRTPEQLAKHDCIAFTATTPIPDRWSFTGPSGRERTVGVRVRLVVNAGDAAIDAAVSGVGIVRALSYQVAPLLTQGKLRAVLRGFSRESVPVQFVHLSGAPSRAAAAFMEFAHPRLRERLKA